MSVTVLILAHGEWLSVVPTHPPFRVIDLDRLPVPDGIPSPAWLSESAFFLSDLMLEPETDYVWLCSGRHDDKRTEIKTRIIDLPNFVPSHPGEIWCVDKAATTWREDSERGHPGITPLIDELVMRFSTKNGRTFYANNWCMHRALIPGFLEQWRTMFWYFHKKYGTDFSYDVGQWHHEQRKGGYFYERLTMVIIANMDLTIRRVP
jgi:hypothetical protein